MIIGNMLPIIIIIIIIILVVHIVVISIVKVKDSIKKHKNSDETVYKN